MMSPARSLRPDPRSSCFSTRLLHALKDRRAPALLILTPSPRCPRGRAALTAPPPEVPQVPRNPSLGAGRGLGAPGLASCLGSRGGPAAPPAPAGAGAAPARLAWPGPGPGRRPGGRVVPMHLGQLLSAPCGVQTDRRPWDGAAWGDRYLSEQSPKPSVVVGSSLNPTRKAYGVVPGLGGPAPARRDVYSDCTGEKAVAP